MKVVAQKYQNVVIEKDDRWELYDIVLERILHTAFKKEEKNYLKAIVGKWGFDEADFEINSYSDLVADWESLGYDSEEQMKAEAETKSKEILLKELEVYQDKLDGILIRNSI